MTPVGLSKKEQLVLFVLIKHPTYTDKEIAERTNLKHSTVTSIRHRLKKNGFYRKLKIPSLQHMGCHMLVVIHTNFSPLIPLEDRVKITGRTIEVFEEIFFSVGEQDKGFSISFSKDFATVGRVNDIRTQTFGKRGLLEEEYPTMVVFPFKISKIYRFFDFAPLIKKRFDLDVEDTKKTQDFALHQTHHVDFSDTEKNAFCMMIRYPEMSDSAIAKEIGLSRHTISISRRRFEEKNLIKTINLPNLLTFGFEILAFYHIKFDPSSFPDMNQDEATLLMSDSTIFFSSRLFEAIMISVYKDYDEYNADMMNIMKILKENKWIATDPVIRTYGLHTLVYIKDFMFAPITQKMIGCDSWVKKLLNI